MIGVTPDRHEETAVGAYVKAEDGHGAGNSQRAQLGAAPAVEVRPLPAAVVRTVGLGAVLVEELGGGSGVVAAQRVLGQADPCGVEASLGPIALTVGLAPVGVVLPQERRHPSGGEHRGDRRQNQHRRQDAPEDRDDRVAPGPAEISLGGPDPPRQDRLIIEEPPQVLRQRLGRGVAGLWVLLDRLEHDRFQVARDARVDRSRPGRLDGLDLLGEPHAVGRVEGRSQHQQLV